MGYDNEVYRLVLLTEREKADLMEQLKVLPGHKAKLMSLIDMIKDVSSQVYSLSYTLEHQCLKCWSAIRQIHLVRSNNALHPTHLISSALTTRATEQLDNI